MKLFGNKISSIFGGEENPNRLATISDVNAVIKGVNVAVPSVNHVIQISQTGNSVPTSRYMATGDVDNCKSNCSSICSACDCAKGCLNETAFTTNFVWQYLGVGNYKLTATFSSAAYAKGILGVALFLSPTSNYNSNISVNSHSSSNNTVWSFNIQTYDLANQTLADGIINGLFADIRVFTN